MAVDLPREIALKILYDINEKGAYSNIVINKYLEGNELKDIDRAFITDLVYGTVKWLKTIDWVIEQHSSIKLKKISPWVLNILRLGVYQLLYTTKVPESAACNESVKLAKRYGHAKVSGFVNALLRGVLRNRDEILNFLNGNIVNKSGDARNVIGQAPNPVVLKFPSKEKEYIKYLSVRYSYPEWMIEEWVVRFGKPFVESLAEAGNTIPDFSARVNLLKITKNELIETLKSAGIEAYEGKYAEEAIIIKNPSAITRLESYKKGYFQVQDESSMLVGRVLDPQPGETVVDVCSAPGGKSTHLAELMKNKGKVIARDVHEHKIKLINDAANRLGHDIIKTELYDASLIDENLIGKADRVLVDAPCTGLGIIRRKPDIKWVRNNQDKAEITALQAKILGAASKYVKPGGVLVYSTCTIEKEENEDIVKNFISSNADFELEGFENILPQGLKTQNDTKGYIQLFPNTNGIDGFFISKLRRKG